MENLKWKTQFIHSFIHLFTFHRSYRCGICHLSLSEIVFVFVYSCLFILDDKFHICMIYGMWINEWMNEYLPECESVCKFVPIITQKTHYYKHTKDLNVIPDWTLSLVRLSTLMQGLLAMAVSQNAKNNQHFVVTCSLRPQN